MEMRKRRLGKSGIEVSALGFGCWAIGGPFTMFGQADGWGEVDDRESVRAIRRAVDLGVNFFDTADAYGTGHSEEVLGEALRGMRDRVVIATKGGFVHDRAARALIGEDTTPAYIRGALEASLLRLRTDYVDLYQIHNGAMPPEHFEPLFHELDKLAAEGKIRAYGWSTWSAENVEAFALKTRGAAIQTKANLLSYDGAASDACARHGLACLCNAPLGMGLLSGKFSAQTRFPPDDVRGAAHRWTEYFENGEVKAEFLVRLEGVREILRSGGRTVAQGALTWLWAKSEGNIPIPGFKSVRQAEENAAAMAFGPLGKAQMDEIETLLGGADQDRIKPPRLLGRGGFIP